MEFRRRLIYLYMILCLSFPTLSFKLPSLDDCIFPYISVTGTSKLQPVGQICLPDLRGDANAREDFDGDSNIKGNSDRDPDVKLGDSDKDLD